MDILSLKQWFLENRRELAWRDAPSPYAVWVSEVMLQQTRASVVEPYFLRWMQVYPTIESLASSSLDEVLKLWEGLGYYSRARNLYFGAKQVMEEFGGKLPSDSENLQKIRGVGPYTQGAILSFAFQKKAIAVDGNVKRVLSRFYTEAGDVTALGEALLPDEEPWLITEALIELGALVCDKVPKCAKCPLRSDCLAFELGKTNEFPPKVKRKEVLHLSRTVAVIESEGTFFVSRVASGKVMTGLFEFPYFPSEQAGTEPLEFLAFSEKRWGNFFCFKKKLPKVTHTFTHHKATLTPLYLESRAPFPSKEGTWYSLSELQKLPFSAGHRRILSYVTHNTH